jgi:acyl dehydratase
LPKREVADIQELQSLVEQEVAVGDWLEITQERINQFADATNDHQWIHVDPERCRRESPFGTTIAHGYLTLSLIPYLSQQSFAIRQPFRMGINYGSNRVRFTSPVPVGSRIRNRMTLLEVSAFPGGWQARWQVTIEIEGKEKPACVAEVISRLCEAA